MINFNPLSIMTMFCNKLVSMSNSHMICVSITNNVGGCDLGIRVTK